VRKRQIFSGFGIIFAILILSTGIISAATFLSNADINAPFHAYFGAGTNKSCGGTTYVTEVADGWDGFEIITTDRLRFFSASRWGQLAACLYGVPPFTESLDGEAQSWVSAKAFDAGIFQTVSGLTPGETYGFSAGIAPAFYTTNRTDPATGKMFRSVGVDPTGGTDPTAATVQWSLEEPHAVFNDGQKYSWFFPSVGFTAQSSNATVFIRVRSIEDVTDGVSINQVWVDKAFLDIAPTISVNVTRLNDSLAQAVWNGSPRPGFHLFAYEAQYKKATDTAWTDLQIFDVLDGNTPPTATDATFPITPGETYIVRARMWHEEDGGSNMEVAGPWVETQLQAGGILNGVVFNNTESTVSGATVAVSGALTQTTSGAGGAFSMNTGVGTFGITATTPTGWNAPAPVWVDVPDTGTGVITLSLRPPDNFIPNGDFEGTLNGWTHTLAAPTFDSSSPRAGNTSLCISESGTLTATAIVTDMYRPTLAFWVRAQGDGNDSLAAEIIAPEPFTVTAPLIFGQDTAGWQFTSLPMTMQITPTGGTGNFGGGTGSFLLPQPEVYSGDIGVRFTVTQNGGTPTTFCLDEVSAGRQWGGTNKVFLPLIFR